jgi:hypothetical protein
MQQVHQGTAWGVSPTIDKVTDPISSKKSSEKFVAKLEAIIWLHCQRP